MGDHDRPGRCQPASRCGRSWPKHSLRSEVAVRRGFEPRLKAPKTSVLPLHHRTKKPAEPAKKPINSGSLAWVSFYQERQPDASRCKDLQINEQIRRLNNPMDRLALAHPHPRVSHHNTITMF